VWVATVGNMDWPSKPGLSTAEQQRELLAILDRSAELRLNAVIFQVRPAGDALYKSSIEPWSEVLTGIMGQAPSPSWDPLQFAIEEAHKRGLELHAWFNPYRAQTPVMKSPIHQTHLSKRKPEWVVKYGRHLWMDPGIPDVRKNTIKVVLDVVKRYDVDGIHIDDYFYPYRENDPATKRQIAFPDDKSYAQYRRNGGTLERDDWRRDNVNTLVRELYAAVKDVKPWVKFGVSPFGIWRPGHPSGVAGLDAHQEIYADARTWVRNGWLDYVVPQLYWALDRPQQPYVPLMAWWAEQNLKGRHLWIGNYTSRVRNGQPNINWPADEIVRQIEHTRGPYGASGNVHFSMEILMKDRGGISSTLKSGPYAEHALVPATPWLDSSVPKSPEVSVERTRGAVVLNVKPRDRERVRFWVVRSQVGGQWRTAIVDGEEARIKIDTMGGEEPAVVAVSALNLVQTESAPTIRVLRRQSARR
jgi:uncharacterized lipoprotein YddW (UPF0748 family)